MAPIATALVFLLPAILILFVFRMLPMVDAIWLSFTAWDNFTDPVWIGLANYQRMLVDPHLSRALLNNAIILLAVPVWVLVPFLLASVLHQRVFGWRFFRFAFFLPVVLSPVVIGIYYGIMFSNEGPLNQTMRAVGLGEFATPWLGHGGLAMFIVISVLIWSSFGVGVVMFLAGMGHVDQDVVDAALVDGARWRDIQVHVVIPKLLPVIGSWSLLVVVHSLTALFPIVYALTSGGPGNSTYVLDYLVYRQAFQSSRLGYASAIGVVLLVIVAIVASLQWRLFRGRGVE